MTKIYGISAEQRSRNKLSRRENSTMEAKDMIKNRVEIERLEQDRPLLYMNIIRAMQEFADLKTKELSTQRDKANSLIKKYIDWVNTGPTVADISESSRVELEIINEMEGYLKNLPDGRICGENKITREAAIKEIILIGQSYERSINEKEKTECIKEANELYDKLQTPIK